MHLRSYNLWYQFVPEAAMGAPYTDQRTENPKEMCGPVVAEQRRFPAQFKPTKGVFILTQRAMTDSTAKHPQIYIQTSHGRMVFQLRPDRTPLTVANVLRYVHDEFYDATLFHRVVDNFIIQGGGFESGLVRKTTRTPIRNESVHGLHNKRGTIAMARPPHDSHAATAQFFINTRDNDMLDYRGDDATQSGYCAFGYLVEGTEIIERIEGVATTTIGEHREVPTQEVIIEKIRLLA